MQPPLAYAQYLRIRLEAIEDERSVLLRRQFSGDVGYTLLRELERLEARHRVTERRLDVLEERARRLNVPTRGTVLVVDDAPDARRLLSFQLGRAGMRVVQAGCGAQALSLMGVGEASAEASSVSMVVMDLQMPGFDGLTATRQLRQHGHTLPVLAVSGTESSDTRDRCLDAGCNDYLSKQVPAETLVQTCQYWMNCIAA